MDPLIKSQLLFNEARRSEDSSTEFCSNSARGTGLMTNINFLARSRNTCLAELEVASQSAWWPRPISRGAHYVQLAEITETAMQMPCKFFHSAWQFFSVAIPQSHTRSCSASLPPLWQVDVTIVLTHLVMRVRVVLSTAEALDPLLAYPAASARRLGRST